MGDTVHGILQARILEWVAFPFSGGSSQPIERTQVSLNAGGFFQLNHKGSPPLGKDKSFFFFFNLLFFLKDFFVVDYF